MKKIITILLIIALVVGAVTLLKKRKQNIKNAPLPNLVPHTVEIVSPKERELKQTRSFLSQLVAKDIARLSSKLSGRIKEILVSENQPIKKGDILVRIDDREIISNVQALNSTQKAQIKEMEYIRNLHARNKVLFETGGLAKEKLDASEVQYFHKKAALETTRQKIIGAKAQLSYLTIVAPFDGIIGTIYLQAGSLATPGQKLISVNSSARKLIFSFVPKRANIIAGKNVIFEDRIIGRISRLYSDAKNGLSVAEASLEAYLARPNGSYLTINVVTFEGSGCTVPINALLHKKSKTQIMVYENNYFKPVHVTIIAQTKRYAIIDPCPTFPVAIGAEAKLSQLPVYGKIRVRNGEQHE
jgi:RND family efflux transporter MFP subunit